MSNPLPYWRGASPQRGRSLADTGRDWADKSWLRRPMLRRRILRFVADLALLAALVFAFAWIISKNEAQASTHWTVLLEDARYPASMDEGQKADPQHRRPLYCISHQERSNEPWNHRFCTYG